MEDNGMDDIMAENKNLILAFESSCDETSVAVIKNGNEILSNIVATQIKSHQRFGGVVPEVASRHHIEEINFCIDDAMSEANVSYDDLDAVAVTYGPGLVGSLLVGLTAAKMVAWAHDLPLIPVNHIMGHIYAAAFNRPIQFPALALVVSGGHTELVYMPEKGVFQIIGETRDDAAGEAYDKIGRVLGLDYPAGKIVDELASKGQDTFAFPRAMNDDDNFDFSFSGLKSSFINTVHHAEQINESLNKNDLSASFQSAVVDVLVHKTKKAIEQLEVKEFILAGGVAANSQLRKTFDHLIDDYFKNIIFEKAPLKLCGDNAAMIGAAAYPLYQLGIFADSDLNANPGLEFEYKKD